MTASGTAGEGGHALCRVGGRAEADLRHVLCDPVQQIRRILHSPVCGNIRIDELTEGDLQKAINMSFKKRCLKKERQRRSSDKPLSRKTLNGDQLFEMVPPEQVQYDVP